MNSPLPSYKSLDLNSLSPFAEIRLIAIDLDGTLLDTNQQTLPDVIQRLSRSLKFGPYDVNLTIATGRTLRGVAQLIRDLRISRYIPIILYNGSIVIDNKFNVIQHKTIPYSSYKSIINICSNYEVKVLGYFCHFLGTKRPEEFAIGWSSIDRPAFEYNSMPVKWLPWEDTEVPIPPSSIVVHTPKGIKDIVSMLRQIDPLKDVSTTLGGESYIEITPVGSSKATGLKYACKSLSLKRNNVLAIGDNDNDAAMLSWAGIGVAVKGASEKAISGCDYVANKGLLDGAVEVIRLVRQAKDLKSRYSRKNTSDDQQNQLQGHVQDISAKRQLTHTHDIFLNVEHCFDFCKDHFQVSIDGDMLHKFIDTGLIPVYRNNNESVLILEDLISFLPILNNHDQASAKKIMDISCFIEDTVRIGKTTYLHAKLDKLKKAPTSFSAIRNLVDRLRQFNHTDTDRKTQLEYFGGSEISTQSTSIPEYIEAQVDLNSRVNMEEASRLTRSVHYMGSKRRLAGFIVEAIASVLPLNGVVLDVMCGSGIASGAFNRIWQTYSSDALQFCRTLAYINGGGFDHRISSTVIDYVTPHFQTHYQSLLKLLDKYIVEEDNLFHRNTDDLTLADYKAFLMDFPTLPNGKHSLKWDPHEERNARLKNNKMYPYCLFTSYFSNVFFGVRQSIEIDSLRYALDQIENREMKQWALGCLLATVSSLGTTYGGHFAQPKIKNISEITIRKFSNIVDSRMPSVAHEYFARLRATAKYASSIPNKIKLLDGPWGNAISLLKMEAIDDPVLVYLDAPYKREEYSRYYHVLETLAKYNYPTCTGKGLTPAPGDRFRSEFFSRKSERSKNVLVSIISTILEAGWHCAWSYSDTGTANMVEVITSISNKYDCGIKSYSTPYEHKAQGGNRNKMVTEYLIIFTPNPNHN